MAQESSGSNLVLILAFVLALVDIGALVVFGLPTFVLMMSITAGLTLLGMTRLAWM